MKSLFINIINVQFGVSVAIAVLILTRGFLKENYKASLRRSLWLIIALRLCLPFDINLRRGRQRPVTLPTPTAKVYTIKTDSDTIYGAATEREYISLQKEVLSQKAETVGTDSYIYTNSVDVIEIAAVVWFLGFAFMVIFTTTAYSKTKRQLLYSGRRDKAISDMVWQIKKEMGIKKYTDVMVAPYTGSPMLIGAVEPVILLPDMEYSPKQLEMIIRHELTHLHKRDIFYKFLLHFTKCIYWFNPLVHIMTKYAARDVELACDEVVSASMDSETKEAYAGTIINMVAVSGNKIMFSTAFSQSAENIKERFKLIFKGRNLKKGKNILCGFIVFTVLASTMVGCGGFVVDTSEKSVDTGGIHPDSRQIYYYRQDGPGTNGYMDTTEGDEFYFNYHNKNIRLTAVTDMYGNVKILCNKPGCNHSDYSCNAALDEDVNTAAYFTVNGATYRLISNFYTDTATTLYKITDSGREQVARFPIGVSVSSGVTDGENLYFAGKILNTDRPINEIYRLSLSDYTLQPIVTLPNYKKGVNDYNLCTVTQNGQFILTATGVKNKNEYICVADENSFAVVKNNKSKDCRHSDMDRALSQQFKIQSAMWSDNIYTLDTVANQLIVQKIGAKDKTILTDDINFKLQVTDFVWIVGIYDGQMLVRTGNDITYDGDRLIDGSYIPFTPYRHQTGQSFYHFINLETGEAYPFTLKARDCEGRADRLNVKGWTDNYIVFATDYTDGYDFYSVPNLAIISKADFFDSVPNYKTVNSNNH